MSRLPDNAPGPFFVDDTCIDCDLCRQIAPENFAVGQGEYSVVSKQPESVLERERAAMALLACPTGSINTSDAASILPFREAYPERIEDDVFFCGYASRDSFGARSYLIARSEGNVLVDSPRFARPLVRRLEAMGGVRTMFLTHRDDVADHAKFRKHFGCERIVHRYEAGTIGAEHLLEGDDEIVLAPELVAIPTPGHTRGHMVLKYRDQFLFTGDHLAWSPRYEHLIAFRRHNWYSWAETIRSMERLASHRFEWILPGHGRPAHYSQDQMQRELGRCIAWMNTVA